MTELLLWRELPLPNARLVRYASGGQMFAVVIGHTIQLYASYAHDLVGTLEGNAAITAVWWGPFDMTVHCGAADGMTYAWKLEGLRRVHEHRTFRGAAISGVAVYTDSGVHREGVGRLERHALALKEGGKEGGALNTLAISGETSLRQICQTSQREKVLPTRAARTRCPPARRQPHPPLSRDDTTNPTVAGRATQLEEVMLPERLCVIDAMDDAKLVVCGA
eukprot:4787322-Prymnesium_polylepis.1